MAAVLLLVEIFFDGDPLVPTACTCSFSPFLPICRSTVRLGLIVPRVQREGLAGEWDWETVEIVWIGEGFATIIVVVQCLTITNPSRLR